MQDSQIHDPESPASDYSLQLELPIPARTPLQHRHIACRDSLSELLSTDLGFHGEDSAYASHNLHAFPAKFPPQLPRTFIEGLTNPDDVVLDPMVGSGTTMVEALLTGRRGIGFDIDPMALRLCRAKVIALPVADTLTAAKQVIEGAQKAVDQDKALLRQELAHRFGPSEREFLDYWFPLPVQLELMALVHQIEQIQEAHIREFLELACSAIIITKSGGVSLARDLAHTRPHRVQDKLPRSAIEEYRKCFTKNLHSLSAVPRSIGRIQVTAADAQALPLRDHTVDLIVTSPPYASNAIDYMRAHKFSLVWLGHSLENLSGLRRQYIGHDATAGVEFLGLPDLASQVVASVSRIDSKKAKVLHRYYSEMTRSLKEMLRVLKPGKAAVIVIGVSTMRGIDTRTDVCLAEIGQRVGFELIGIGARELDRDKRMMPVRGTPSGAGSQIEQRMHEEYIIGFVKPESR